MGPKNGVYTPKAFLFCCTWTLAFLWYKGDFLCSLSSHKLAAVSKDASLREEVIQTAFIPEPQQQTFNSSFQ